MNLFKNFTLLAALGLTSQVFAIKPLPKKELNDEFVPKTDLPVDAETIIAVRKNPGIIENINAGNPSAPVEKMYENSSEKSKLQIEALARQYVILIDKSGSMSYPDTGNPGKTKWQSTAEAVKKLVPEIFKHDIDHTVPVYLFGHDVTPLGEIKNSKDVEMLFSSSDIRPDGRSTNLLAALQAVIPEYVRDRKNRATVPGTTIVVFTDGSPDDAVGVTRYITDFVRNKENLSNDTELAISFVRVGDDEGAIRFLESLDDELEVDVCDHKPDDFLRLRRGENYIFTNKRGVRESRRLELDGVEQLLYDAIFD